MDVVIVGAGTFGASLAWWLARAGDRVTLVDQFEPGDRRATSGGETRLIRCSHGTDPDYTAMARRARTLWRELEAESGEELMVECGVAWFAREMTAGTRAPRARWPRRASRSSGSSPARRRGCTRASAATTSPSCCWSLRPASCAPSAPCVHWRGRRRPTVRGWCAGGHGPTARRRCSRTARGSRVTPWCGRAAAGWRACSATSSTIKVTRQELLFLDGGPAWRGVPAWVDYERAMYGTGDLDALGVKAALDLDGPPLDPDAELDDAPTTEPAVRAYMRERFPALERARWPRRAPAATSCRPTRTSSRAGLPRARGCSAAAPATASSTARRWPSGWPPPSRARRRCPTASRSARACPREVCARRGRV